MTTLEETVQRLEETVAIHELKYEYGRLIDEGLAAGEGFPQQALLDQFTEDAIWEANVHGRFEGRQAFGEFLAGVSESVSFSLHYMMNPTIRVEPPFTAATGRWLSFETLTIDGGAVWLATDYDDVYTKESGRWQFRHVTAEIFFMTPYEKGWVKEPFLGEPA